jgi:hypothetical protein
MFTLSANDFASGTSQFEVAGVPIPEPSVFILMLFGLMGMVLGYRRR